MENKIYITEEEKEKCRRVADAFLELYESTDTVVVDVGKYGFVKLQYYKLPAGFESMITYRDSETMFNDLWEDWLYGRLLMLVMGTPAAELEYEDIFKRLPDKQQEELMAKRIYFKEKSGLGLDGE